MKHKKWSQFQVLETSAPTKGMMYKNFKKTKGLQPDYRGAMNLVDDDGNIVPIILSAWVIKARSGNSILTLSCQTKKQFQKILDGLSVKRKNENDMDRQRVSTEERFKQQVNEGNVIDLTGCDGDDISDMYFDAIGRSEDEGVQEEKSEDDNISASRDS